MKIYFKINSTASTYIVGVMRLKLPHNMFSNTYAIIPNRIPSEIEYAIGIITMVTNAGIDSA